MNYCEKIHYTILNTEPAEFAVMVDDLLSQLPQNEVIMRLAFIDTMLMDLEHLFHGSRTPIKQIRSRTPNLNQSRSVPPFLKFDILASGA